MESMESTVDQKIITKLITKIAQLEYNQAILEVSLEDAHAHNRELMQQLDELTQPKKKGDEK